MREALDRILAGHLPYPAVVVRPYGELVAANAALSVLTEGAAPDLLAPPVNVLRLALHPEGMAPRGREPGRVGPPRRREPPGPRAAEPPDPRLDAFVAELEGYLPPAAPGPDHVGFSVPLRLRTGEGELRLITTLTSFATAVDVTLSELRLEAFLPADEATAEFLRRRQPSTSAGTGLASPTAPSHRDRRRPR